MTSLSFTCSLGRVLSMTWAELTILCKLPLSPPPSGPNVSSCRSVFFRFPIRRLRPMRLSRCMMSCRTMMNCAEDDPTPCKGCCCNCGLVPWTTDPKDLLIELQTAWKRARMCWWQARARKIELYSVGGCRSLSSRDKGCEEPDVMSARGILLIICTKAFAASNASFTTGEFTVKGVVMIAHSSSRVAPVTRLLSFHSCSVGVSFIPSSREGVGLVPEVLDPELSWILLSPSLLYVKSGLLFQLYASPSSMQAMVMSIDGIMMSLRSYPATSLLESTLERSWLRSAFPLGDGMSVFSPFDRLFICLTTNEAMNWSV